MRSVYAMISIMFVLMGSSPIVAEKLAADKPLSAIENTGIVIEVYDASERECFEIELEEYLIGVVFAEMPSSFEPEALKAQAVASRTYILRRVDGGICNHISGSVCTDYRHCTAYISFDEACEKYGYDSCRLAFDKIRRAVEETAGEILVCDGKIIDALFHAESSGFTEDAVAVWGSEYSYLVSVSSPERAEVSSVSYTPEEFSKILTELNCTVAFDSSPDDWIERTEINNSGRIDTVTVCGIGYSGAGLRTAFKLKSTAFKLRFDGDVFTFTVSGWGHGVGMSQCGANEYAKKGWSYRDILTHYYSNCTIKKT